MLKLQTDQDPRTGIKVLTCYLLPQSTSHPGELTVTASLFSFLIDFWCMVALSVFNHGWKVG